MVKIILLINYSDRKIKSLIKKGKIIKSIKEEK
jgi:uncharacterized protein with GYD domain